MKFPRITETVAPLGPDTRAFMAEANDMKLPPGRTCRDCAHLSRCVGCGFSWPERDQCDFLPNRFKLAQVPSAPADMTIVEGVANTRSVLSHSPLSPDVNVASAAYHKLRCSDHEAEAREYGLDDKWGHQVPSAPADMTIVEGVANTRSVLSHSPLSPDVAAVKRIIMARKSECYGAWCTATDEQAEELARNLVQMWALREGE